MSGLTWSVRTDVPTDAPANAPEHARPRGAAVRRIASGEPLLRNGHLLSASSVLTSVLGAGYWALVTRLYPTDAVGRNYAAISAMLFLAGVGQLNLTNVLVRFVPVAGARTGRLVARAYLAAAATTFALAVAFVLLLPEISPGLAFLHRPLVGAGFAAATAGYALFVLQDGALTGLRRAHWVVLENAVFSVVKIGAVVLFALVVKPGGILLSWAVGLAVAVAVTNSFLFGRAIPLHERAARRPRLATTPMQPTPTTGYIVCDYIGALCWIAATTLPPLIVLERLGAAQAAYFSLTWVIAYTLYLLSANMGSSLIVESATDPERLAQNCRRVLGHTGALLAICVLIMIAGAPAILRVFGDDYARHGTGLLRFLLLSAVPNLVVAVAVSTCRARRRMTAVIAILGTLCSLALVLIVVLLPVMGVEGAGVAWLAAQGVVAAVLLWRRSIWLGSAGGEKAGAIGVPPRVLAGFVRERLGWFFSLPGDLRLGRRLSSEVQLNSRGVESHVSRTVSGLLLIRSRGQADLVVKHPLSPRAHSALEQQYETLRTLSEDERLGEWRRLLPQVVSLDLLGTRPMALEARLPGIDASRVVRERPTAARRIAKVALAAIAELHEATGRVETVGTEHLRRWVEAPLAVVCRELAPCQTPHGAAAIDLLRRRLYEGLEGKRVLVAWTHGDYQPGNVLIDADPTRITGVVDWCSAHADGPAPLDARLFSLAVQRELERCEIGDLVVRAYRREGEAGFEVTGVEAGGATTVDEVSLLLLTWLTHVADNTAKSARYQHSWRWLARNVVPVLREVSR
ncbi:MAG TPA: phosphotransferase [Actinocrinis sp.]|uniref:phosphotransferase n=1 Tax=Actinocrinis sp. TaxID=1920516 RepID=UPI002DDD2C38|nr:phosphotransferase [Actinocrinis sp.]HEV3173231.1 phosphotransferase [Actinocrinis sp.]